MSRLSDNIVWYTRRAGTVRGPFSAGYVARYILLGRIRMNDELSQDRQSWQPVMDCTELFPDEMTGLSSWDDYQRLVMARIRIDERQTRRRQETDNKAVPAGLGERRHLPDRRKADRNPERLFVHLLSRPGSVNRNQPGFPLRVFLMAALLVTVAVAWFTAAYR